MMTHHLVGLTEIAEMFGLSRQRVDQLVRGDDGFPEPEVTVAAGRIWSREAVEAWATAMQRHFCLPGGKPAPNRGVTEIHCNVCGRVWTWEGMAWKNTRTPTLPVLPK